MIQVAMLWLMNEHGELLLARRADHKVQDPGLWGPSVTGKLEAGETFEQAVSREAEEELALAPAAYTPEFLFGTDFVHPDGVTRRFKVYAAKVPSDITEQLRIDTNEVSEIKWLPIDAIKQQLHRKPGETIVASAFTLWNQIFDALEAHKNQ